ncbi:PP2C family protein-serine/threonine phosphatase [Pseudonocardia benzenivorans]
MPTYSPHWSGSDRRRRRDRRGRSRRRRRRRAAARGCGRAGRPDRRRRGTPACPRGLRGGDRGGAAHRRRPARRGRGDRRAQLGGPPAHRTARSRPGRAGRHRRRHHRRRGRVRGVLLQPRRPVRRVLHPLHALRGAPGGVRALPDAAQHRRLRPDLRRRGHRPQPGHHRRPAFRAQRALPRHARGHLPVRSYLAVPVISPTSGEVLGGFFFGHPEPGRFTDRHEYLAEGIAGYSAIALDNSRLFERECNLARELSRSMLPEAPPVAGLEIVTRYLPAATGSKIGGDWFDVIPLPGDATAFVIGDVVGHGVTAATVMGQARTAVRCYAVLGLPPSRVLHQTSAVLSAFTASTFVTCFYAVHSADGTLRYANAGHLPALLRHVDGTLTEFGEALGQPLGVGASFPERTIRFGIGDELLLYTDGLVESRTRDLTVGMGWLRSAVAALPRPVTAELCDGLVAELTGGAHDDDVALIHVRNTGRGVA